MSDELDLEYFRRLLEQRLAELQRLGEEEPTRERTVELDQAKVGRLSRMDALQQQAMLDASHTRNRVERERLRRALLRLDAGDYGYCSQCGEAIPLARLQVDPASVLCNGCAAAAERQLQ
nr:TraR/DksA C4-type zinc finger protein [uncultured Pseudomonas sp.]